MKVASHAQTLTYVPKATLEKPNPDTASSCLYSDDKESIVVSCVQHLYFAALIP